MDPIAQLQMTIAKFCGLAIHLVINENSSHLFTILERKASSVRVSVHRMFLEAPLDVVEALASYVRKLDKQSLSVVSRYIDTNIYLPEYSQKIEPSELVTFGDHYDLKEALIRVNEHYFEGAIHLPITWFRQKSMRSRMIFGQYHPLLRLVKINKKLDNPLVPSYFLDYVIYHEMLHHIIPTKTNQAGRRSIHSSEFRKKERLFEDFAKAVEWQNSHRPLFFSDY